MDENSTIDQLRAKLCQAAQMNEHFVYPFILSESDIERSVNLNESLSTIVSQSECLVL
jgi:hypothetical protein